MRPVSTSGHERPTEISPGVLPELRWIPINDLRIGALQQTPIGRRAQAHITSIAKTFSWASCAPVVVVAIDDGKFAIVDGVCRSTAAAVVGIEVVPCQIIVANAGQQALARQVLNRERRPASRMTAHAAGLRSSEPATLRVTDVCRRGGVELLRYPVAADRQSPGQTMAVAAIAQCLTRYGEATLITALQCVTQTANNLPGVLTGRMIKALCAVLDADHDWRDRGLPLLEAFDGIDLAAIQWEAMQVAERKKTRPQPILIEQIRAALAGLLLGREQSGRHSFPSPRSKIFAAGRRPANLAPMPKPPRRNPKGRGRDGEVE